MTTVLAAVGGWPYVAVAWSVTGVALGVYTVGLLRRGRRLSRRVPEGDRRWM